MSEKWALSSLMGSRYPERRTSLLEALGMDAQVQRSDRIKQETGLYCRERAGAYYRQRREQGASRLGAIKGGLDDLTHYCVNESPCGQDIRATATPETIRRQRNHLAMTSIAYALLDRIPDGQWEKIMAAIKSASGTTALAAVGLPNQLPDCGQLYDCYTAVDYYLFNQGAVGNLTGLNCDGRGSAPVDLVLYTTFGLGLSYVLCYPHILNNSVTSCNSRVVTTTAGDGTKTKVTIPVRDLSNADLLICNPFNRNKKEPVEDVRHDVGLVLGAGAGIAAITGIIYSLANLGVLDCS